MAQTQFGFIRIFTIHLLIVVAGFLIPESPLIPVEGASRPDWHSKSFWFEPWGRSGVHTGIDIFAEQNKPVISAVPGLVIYRGHWKIAGNVIVVLGPKWRIHYYANLAEDAPVPQFVSSGDVIGNVGASGKLAGRFSHIHYAVISIFPLPWNFSTATEGWKRMFFLNPSEMFK